MHLRSRVPALVLLLLLCLLEVKAEEGGHLQDALKALDLLFSTDHQPQLQKNHTGILIARLLQAVHCAERTSQDVCDKVRPLPV